MSFDPNQIAKVVTKPVETKATGDVEIVPFSARSDEDRLKDAREHGIQVSKKSNWDSHYSFGYTEAHWKDFAGPRTSHYDANELVATLSMLQEPKYMGSGGQWVSYGNYDAHLGAWVRKLSHGSTGTKQTVSTIEHETGTRQIVATIDDVRKIVSARIAELNLDPVLIAEFMSRSLIESFSGIPEEQAWRSMPFEERMKRFAKV